MNGRDLSMWSLVVGAMTIAAATLQAQEFGRGGFGGGGRFSPEESFRRIDRNGSGTIEPEEWEALPMPIRRAFEDVADLSSPMDFEEFADVSRKMAEQMMSRFGNGRSGDFGRGEGLGRRDRDSDNSSDGEPSSEDRDSGSRRSRGWFGARGGNRGGDDGEGDSSASAGGADRKSEKSDRKSSPGKSLLNAKLPEQYRSRDKDRDGQIAFHEWPQSDYKAFQKLDRNGDGFLTPQELLRAGGKSASSSSKSSDGPSTSSKGNSDRGEGAGVSSTATANAGPKTPAETAFNLIDKDKDGTLSEAEWGKSILASKKFRDAGIEVRFPLSRADFHEKYPKAYGSTGK